MTPGEPGHGQEEHSMLHGCLSLIAWLTGICKGLEMEDWVQAGFRIWYSDFGVVDFVEKQQRFRYSVKFQIVRISPVAYMLFYLLHYLSSFATILGRFCVHMILTMIISV